MFPMCCGNSVPTDDQTYEKSSSRGSFDGSKVDAGDSHNDMPTEAFDELGGSVSDVSGLANLDADDIIAVSDKCSNMADDEESIESDSTSKCDEAESHGGLAKAWDAGTSSDSVEDKSEKDSAVIDEGSKSDSKAVTMSEILDYKNMIANLDRLKQSVDKVTQLAEMNDALIESNMKMA